MVIEKRDSGKNRYREYYNDPLTNERKSVSLTHHKAAKQGSKLWNEMVVRLNGMIEDILIDNNNFRSNMTFEDLSKKWFKVYSLEVKKSTAHNVNSRLRVINQSLGKILLRKIYAGLINEILVSQVVDMNLRYRTVSLDKSIILRIIRFGISNDYMKDSNYESSVEVPKTNMSRKQEWKYLEPEEFDLLIKQLEDKQKFEMVRLCKLQTATGMRFNEMVSLDYREHIDLENKVIHIVRNYDIENNIFTTPKTGVARDIYINDEIIELIKEQITYDQKKMIQYNLNRKNTLLFRDKFDRPVQLRQTNNRLRTYTDIPGKKISTHIFRHTFITRMVENKVDKELIAKHVGHSSTKMIDQVYGHFTSKMDAELKSVIQTHKII